MNLLDFAPQAKRNSGIHAKLKHNANFNIYLTLPNPNSYCWKYAANV